MVIQKTIVITYIVQDVREDAFIFDEVWRVKRGSKSYKGFECFNCGREFKNNRNVLLFDVKKGIKLMADFDNNRFQSKNQEYATPWGLFKVLDDEFHFTLDVCADNKNHKVDTYFTEQDNALTQDWNGVCWMNPPYKDMKKWIIKAYNESVKNNSVVVCLIPARTNTSWWHDYCMKGEIRFIKGRPKFEGCIHGLPQPLAVVVFGKQYKNTYKSVIF